MVFRYHDDEAASVNLVGDFNEWNTEASSFARGEDGLWTVSIPCRPAGRYRYKFRIDDVRWTEDPSHGLKEEDGFGGFHSILLLER